MRLLIRLIRIYTPFICTVMALLNGVLFMGGVTELPASVTINQLGMTQGLIKIVCGKSNCYAINSSLTVTISTAA